MKFHPKDYLGEIFLILVLIHLFILYINDYTGFMLCLFLGTISAAVLAIAGIAELVERSKIARWYFILLGITATAPFVALIVYSLIIQGNFEWLKTIQG